MADDKDFPQVRPIDEFRKALAGKHDATIGCPITTGIFAWIAARDAAEAEGKGCKNPTPYWRTCRVIGRSKLS